MEGWVSIEPVEGPILTSILQGARLDDNIVLSNDNGVSPEKKYKVVSSEDNDVSGHRYRRVGLYCT